MTPIRINDKLLVAGEISAADLPEISALGIVLIVNNRPDGEEWDQPAHAAMRQAADAAGIEYLYLPVTGATISAEAADTLHTAIEAARGKVLAHCRSGARSFTLWAIGEVMAGRMRPEGLVALAVDRGCDPSGALAWLKAKRTTAVHS